MERGPFSYADPALIERDLLAAGHAHFTAAADGTMAYLSGPDPASQSSLVLVDRDGAERLLTTERAAFRDVAVSPDGMRLATTVIAANDSLWKSHRAALRASVIRGG